jgi:hypothetical protein
MPSAGLIRVSSSIDGETGKLISGGIKVGVGVLVSVGMKVTVG